MSSCGILINTWVGDILGGWECVTGTSNPDLTGEKGFPEEGTSDLKTEG